MIQNWREQQDEQQRLNRLSSAARQSGSVISRYQSPRKPAPTLELPLPAVYSYKLGISTYPRITLALIKAKFNQAAALYPLIQTLVRDRGGHEIFTLAELQDWCAERDLLSQRRVSRYLDQCVTAGVVTTDGQRYWLVSWAKVTARFEVDYPGQRVDLPDQIFRQGIGTITAALQAATHHEQKHGLYPSRKTQAVNAGVSKRTVQAWDKRAGTHVQRRVTMTNAPTNRAAAVNMHTRGYLPKRYWMGVFDSQAETVVRQMALFAPDGKRLRTDHEVALTLREDFPDEDRFPLVLLWHDTNAYESRITRKASRGRARRIVEQAESFRSPDYVQRRREHRAQSNKETRSAIRDLPRLEEPGKAGKRAVKVAAGRIGEAVLSELRIPSPRYDESYEIFGGWDLFAI